MRKLIRFCDKCGNKYEANSGTSVAITPDNWSKKGKTHDLCRACAEEIVPAILGILGTSQTDKEQLVP